MAADHFMLELHRTRWQLHASRDEDAQWDMHEFEESDVVAQAEVVREELGNVGYRGEPITVALGSHWCLATTLQVSRPQELRDRKTMLFRLEEHIPWSIDECVGDYLPAGNEAVMVAVPAAPLAEFFRRLESLSIQIQSIVPQTILSVVEHLNRGPWPNQHVIVFEQQDWVDVVCVENGKPTSWVTLPVRGTAFTCELKRLAVERGLVSAVVGYDLAESAAHIASTASEGFIEPLSLIEETGGELACAAARKIAHGQMEPPLEFKRDQFGRNRGNVALRRYATTLQIAVAILVLTVSGTLFYRGHAAGRVADALTARQSELFRTILPNTKVPVGIAGRFESELAKLKGLQGQDSSLPGGVSALSVLQRMVAALPTDRRFRLLEIRVEEGRLYLDGEVIQHGDAEAIAQRIRAAAFEVASPRTQRLDDKRVSLRITGTLAPINKLAARKQP